MQAEFNVSPTCFQAETNWAIIAKQYFKLPGNLRPHGELICNHKSLMKVYWGKPKQIHPWLNISITDPLLLLVKNPYTQARDEAGYRNWMAPIGDYMFLGQFIDKHPITTRPVTSYTQSYFYAFYRQILRNIDVNQVQIF